MIFKYVNWDFPGGPVVKNLPSNAGDAGSNPGWRTKIPHDVGQLSPRTTTTEPAHPGACTTTREKPVRCKEEPVCRNERSHMPQLRPDIAK